MYTGKIIKISFFFFIVSLCSCGIILHRKTNNKSYANRSSYKDNWEKTLEKGKISAKSFWIESLNSNWVYYAKMSQLEILQSDISSAELLPVFTYKLESTSISGFNTNSSIDKLLLLDSTKATYYVTKDQKIISVIYYGYRNGNWVNEGGFSGIFPEIARKVENVIFEKKANYFDLSVYKPAKKQPFHVFSCYVEGKEFYSIRPSGKSVLLKDELIKLKDELNK